MRASTAAPPPSPSRLSILLSYMSDIEAVGLLVLMRDILARMSPQTPS
jgi:hypothetical protein